jgi:hypothetical protein
VLVLVYRGTAPALEGHGGQISAETAQHGAPQHGVTMKAEARPEASAKPVPGAVEDMREAILAAAHSGRIEELKVPLDWNELKPDLGAPQGADLIAYLKKLSGDGEGREILAILANILEMKPAAVPLGKDIENNTIYVWPYLAEAKLDALTPAEEVDLLRLVSPEKAKAMRAAKKWTWWRLSIGADGTWHSFKMQE